MGTACQKPKHNPPLKLKTEENHHSFNIHDKGSFHSDDDQKDKNEKKRNGSRILTIHNSSIMINPKMEFTEINPLKSKGTFDQQWLDELLTSSEDIRRIYKISENPIAHGNFGTVRKAHLMNYPKKEFAIKSIEKKKIQNNFSLMKTELDIMKLLDFPNVVKYYETYQDNKFVHLVMEYLSGGELFDKILMEEKLKESQAMIIMKKIFRAVKYLHNQNICHRDLKLENFIFSHKGETAEIKIIDFGLSKRYLSEKIDTLSTIVGTALYVPPEVLKGKYDYRCDLWSLGVVMFILLGGYPPFFGDDNKEIFKKVMIGTWGFDNDIWLKITKQAKDLISKLIVVDPEKRISASDALKHPWFTRFVVDDEGFKFDKKIITNLRNFHKFQSFQKEVMRVIFSLMNEDEIITVKETFNIIDADHDGRISIEELETYFLRYNIKDDKESLRRMVKIINDNEETEFITYTNFMMAAKDPESFRDQEKVDAAYRYFDVDNKGYIDNIGLGETLRRGGGKNIKEHEVAVMMSECGCKDIISKAQFYEMIMNKKILEEEDYEEVIEENTKIGKITSNNLKCEKK